MFSNLSGQPLDHMHTSNTEWMSRLNLYIYAFMNIYNTIIIEGKGIIKRAQGRVEGKMEKGEIM